MPRFNPRVVHMEFVGDKITLEAFLLLAFCTNCHYTSVSSVASTNGHTATTSVLQLPSCWQMLSFKLEPCLCGNSDWVCIGYTGMFSQLKRSLTDLRGLHKSASAATMTQRHHQHDCKAGRWCLYSLCTARCQHCPIVMLYNIFHFLLKYSIIFCCWTCREV